MSQSVSGRSFSRRAVLRGAGATLLAGTLPACSSWRTRDGAHGVVPAYQPTLDRLIGITVCSRPFRAR